MRLSDFDYDLPESAIAQAPAAERDGARLLVHELAAGRTRHLYVRDLPDVLAPGDLLVFNDTRVRAARFFARRPSIAGVRGGPAGGGGRVELLLLDFCKGEPPTWRAMVRPAGSVRAGEALAVEGGSLVFTPLERLVGEDGRPGAEWRVGLIGGPRGEELEAQLEREGELPLPPYVRRPEGPSAEDGERYQTVFAKERGAVAAPTAGLHFTDRLLGHLEGRGIGRETLTLHVGPGTFRPVSAEDPREHRMHGERYTVPAAAARAHNEARARGARVVAVGTTVVRALETVAAERGEVAACTGETAIYILPGHRFRAVDALLTNFHLPRSTLLMLVSAFAGRERTLALYAEALAEGYRFYSFGDAMLLLP